MDTGHYKPPRVAYQKEETTTRNKRSLSNFK